MSTQSVGKVNNYLDYQENQVENSAFSKENVSDLLDKAKKLDLFLENNDALDSDEIIRIANKGYESIACIQIHEANLYKARFQMAISAANIEKALTTRLKDLLIVAESYAYRALEEIAFRDVKLDYLLRGTRGELLMYLGTIALNFNDTGSCEQFYIESLEQIMPLKNSNATFLKKYLATTILNLRKD